MGRNVDKNFLASENAIVRRSTISISRLINITFRRIYMIFFQGIFQAERISERLTNAAQNVNFNPNICSSNFHSYRQKKGHRHYKTSPQNFESPLK